jgi:hypothetical protein
MAAGGRESVAMNPRVNMIDLVFLIDSTRSMASSVNAAHDNVAEIASNLRAKYPTIKFEFGSVCYRDPVDNYCDKYKMHRLSANVDWLVDFLATVHAKGGGGNPEDWVGAYDLALPD